MVKTVKNPPTIQENCILSLDWEDCHEEGKATHSSILVWRFPMDSGAWQATMHEVAKSQTQSSDVNSTYNISYVKNTYSDI